MKKIEAQAWADAGFIAEQAVKWDNKEGNALQPLADYWMGNDSVKDEYAKVIKDAFSNEKKIHNPNWFFPESVVDVYCGEHPVFNTYCLPRKNPYNESGPMLEPFAVSRTYEGRFWNTYNIVLCPRFFNEKYALEEIMKNMTDSTLDRYDAQNYKKAWGFTYFHELMHVSPIIADDDAWDVVYGSRPVAKLAYWNNVDGPVRWKPKNTGSYRGSEVSLNNADSFAFFGASSLFKYRLGFGEQPKAKNTCDFYNPHTYADESTETIVDGVMLATENRTDGTYNYTVPPNPDPGNTPANDEIVALAKSIFVTSVANEPRQTICRCCSVLLFAHRYTEKTYPPTTVPASLMSITL